MATIKNIEARFALTISLNDGVDIDEVIENIGFDFQSQVVGANIMDVEVLGFFDQIEDEELGNNGEPSVDQGDAIDQAVMNVGSRKETEAGL